MPYAGRLAEKVELSLAKMRSSMCNCGVLSVAELHEQARVTRVSELTIVEGGTSNVERLDRASGDRG